jgi:hypothetical protein
MSEIEDIKQIHIYQVGKIHVEGGLEGIAYHLCEQ